MFNVSTKETDAIMQFSGQAKQLYIVKEVVNPYFKKKFENFIKTYSIPPKTLIYSIFKIHSYFLKNLKIPPKTAN